MLIISTRQDPILLDSQIWSPFGHFETVVLAGCCQFFNSLRSRYCQAFGVVVEHADILSIIPEISGIVIC